MNKSKINLKNKKNYLIRNSWLYLIIVLCILSLPLISADSNKKSYNPIDKSAILKDSNNVNLAKAQLVFNTYSCSDNCFAVIKVTGYKNYKDVISSLRFEDLKNKKDKSVNYKIEIKKDKKYEIYDSNKELNGDFYIKISGSKDWNEVIDWIPTLYGIEVTEWAVWGNQYTYDDFNDGNINSTLWSNATTGAGTTTEAGGYIIAQDIEATNNAGSSTINSKIFPNYNDIKNISIIVNLSVSQCEYNNGNTATFSVFGNIIKSITCDSTSCASVNNSLWNIIKNNSQFDVYSDGIYQTTITPSNNNITFVASASAGSPCSLTAFAKSDYVYYVYDESSMNINLNSPSNNFNNYNINNVTFNISTNTSINNLKNITLYLNNIINESKTISGTSNLTIFNKLLGLGTYTWKVKVCDDESNCKNSSEYNLISKPFLENNITYNLSTYETYTETFILNSNITGYSNASFVYNGTSYSISPTISSGNYIFTKSINIPVNTINNSFYWVINGFNSTINYQTVSRVYLSLCNSTNNVTFINFTFKDEGNGSIINGKADLVSWIYWLGTGLINNTYYFTNTSENSNYAFCFNPSHSTVNINLQYFQYSSSGYPQRQYFRSGSLTNSTTDVVLYLLGSSDGIYSSYQITSVAGTQISGATVQVERQFDGVWTLIGQATSDSSGLTTFWVNPNFDHRITASKTGYTSSSVTIRPTQSLYTIILGGSGSTNGTYAGVIEGITYKRTPGSGIIQPGSQLFTYNISSSKSNMVNCKFELYYSNGTMITYNSSSCTSNAYLTLTYVVSSGDKLKGRYYVDMGTGYIMIEGDSEWITITSNSSSWRTLQGFFQFLVDDSQWTDGSIEEQKQYEFTKLVFFFFIVAILAAALNIGFGFDNNNPGIFIFALPFIITFLSLINGINGQGFFYSTGNTYFVFMDNFLLCFTSWLLAIGYYMATMRRDS